MQNFWQYVESVQKSKTYKVHYESKGSNFSKKMQELVIETLGLILGKEKGQILGKEDWDNDVIPALKNLSKDKLKQYKTVLIQKIFKENGLLETTVDSAKNQKLVEKKKEIIKKVNELHSEVPNFARLPSMQHTN